MYKVNEKQTITLSRKSIVGLLEDVKEMQELAVEIKKMYELLDDRYHQLTYITMRMERKFSTLFTLVYGCQLHNRDFKTMIEKIAEEKEQIDLSHSKTFFTPLTR